MNIENVPAVLRRKKEEERRLTFLNNLDKLYDQAVFSDDPKDFYGADIWRYFYEDLKVDYVKDTLTQNFLFLLTDGYPIVGKDLTKLPAVNQDYPDLKIVLIEAAPRDKDLEWDRVNDLWKAWFDGMKIDDYVFIKRMALSKEKDMLQEIVVDSESNAGGTQ